MRYAFLLILLALGCSPSSEGGNNTSDAEESLTGGYRNVTEGVTFVGDEACFQCHESEYRGFKEHGMAHSFYPLTRENAVEPFGSGTVVDAKSGLRYTTVASDSGFYMEEFLLDEDGRKTHSLFREMKYVVGSGTIARTYLGEENGWYYELPITWYTQASRWDFSPGYEIGNKRFDRKINNRCIACHNSYPQEVPQAQGKYEEMPFGISCERCHGPGALHVEERLSSPEVEGAIDYSIVNPAHLSTERKLDVCQQCHLNATVSLLREDTHAFDFRPSQALSEFVALFSSREMSDSDNFAVISHAERLQQSACFILSAPTNRPMDCVTCHDPHASFEAKESTFYNATCLDCHAPSSLESRLAGSPAAGDHVPEANCVDCHMPKTDLTEAPHSAFTDHWIRVVGRGDSPVQPINSRSSDLLKAHFERDRQDEGGVYEGMAYVVYGRQEGDLEMLRRGVAMLESALRSNENHDEAIFLLGYGHQLLGQHQEAIPFLEKAVSIAPHIGERANALAQSLEATDGDPGRIEQLYRQALQAQPALADVRLNFGRFLETQGRIQEAVSEYTRAVREEPWNDLGHYNLGTALMRLGDATQAVLSLEAAIELDPFHAGALTNMGVANAITGDEIGAEAWFERAVRADPDHPDALDNLATLYVNTNRENEAIPMLEKLIRIRGDSPDVMAKLALGYFRVERYREAGEWARKALQQDPGHELARQILNAL